MGMQQMMERLLAGQEEMKAKAKAYREALNEMNANMKSNLEKADANRKAAKVGNRWRREEG
jgi:hypothetical protein